MLIARDIRDYFNSSQELLDVRVSFGGEQSALFNQGGILHMRDVKGLVQGVYRSRKQWGYTSLHTWSWCCWRPGEGALVPWRAAL